MILASRALQDVTASELGDVLSSAVN